MSPLQLRRVNSRGRPAEELRAVEVRAANRNTRVPGRGIQARDREAAWTGMSVSFLQTWAKERLPASFRSFECSPGHRFPAHGCSADPATELHLMQAPRANAVEPTVGLRTIRPDKRNACQPSQLGRDDSHGKCGSTHGALHDFSLCSTCGGTAPMSSEPLPFCGKASTERCAAVIA